MNLFTPLRALTAALALAFAAPLALSVQAPALAEDAVLYAGGWTNVKQKTSGGWRIVERDGATYIEFDDAFKTRGAPDLKVFLSTEDAATRTNRNALENAVLIGELKSTKDAQSYRTPDGVTVSDYATLLIHCEQYTKFWAASPLTPAGG